MTNLGNNDPKKSVRLYKQNGDLWFEYDSGSDTWNLFNKNTRLINMAGAAGLQDYLAWNGGTGLIDIALPGLTKTGDTEFTLHAGCGVFLDMTDPKKPDLTFIEWDDITGITDSFAATAFRTWVTLDVNGSVVQYDENPTAVNIRTHIQIGVLTHTDGATITQVNLLPVTMFDIGGKLTDLCKAVGFVNLEGNLYSGASAGTLDLAVSAGKSFACDRNYFQDKDSPNVNVQDAESPIATFFEGYRDGVGGGGVTQVATEVNTTQYDDGTGTLATLSDGFWVNHRIYRSTTTGTTIFVFGQSPHQGRVESITSIETENFDPPPGADQLMLRGYLTIKKGATDLQDSDFAIFTPANKFGTGPANRPTNGFDLGIPDQPSDFFSSRGLGAGTYYMFGEYKAPAADVTLTQASTTQVFGTANTAYGMRPFAVFAGDGTVDAGQVGLRVTGTTFTDSGVRTGADTQVLTDDITAPITDEYAETLKKFNGQVTYELYVVSGSPTTYSVSFNYGMVKYEDLGNRDFMLTDLEFEWIGGANDTGAEIDVLKHGQTGFTYNATAFVPGNGVIASMTSLYGAESNVSLNQKGFFKLDETALNVPIRGSQSEGIVVKVVTTQPNTFQTLRGRVGAEF